MGHLISASALRLGWSMDWRDHWFLEKQYYTDYLYTLFRLRFYLVTIFSRKKIEKLTIIYSHFEIYKQYKDICVNIFYYNAQMEADYFEWKTDFFFKWIKYKKKKFKLRKKSNSYIMPYRILSFWFLFDVKLNYDNIRKYIRYKTLVKWFRNFRLIDKLKKDHIYSVLSNSKVLSSKKYNKLYIWSYFLVYKEIMLCLKKNRGFSQHTISVFKRYYMYIKIYLHEKFQNEIYAFFLKHLLSNFIKYWNVLIAIYIIDNDTVTAKFLSKYIARKLKLQFILKDLLKPVLKDLKLVASNWKTPKSSYFKLQTRGIINKLDKVTLFQRRTLFKNLIYKTINLYWTRLDMYIYLYKTNFTINTIIIQTWFTAYKFKNKFKNLFKYYHIKKGLFVVFFEKSMSTKNNKFIPSYLDIHLRVQDYNIFTWVCDYFFTHKWSILNWITYTELDMKSLRYSCIHLQKYLKYQYWQFNYKVWMEKHNNFLKSRSTIYSRISLLKGLKIHCVGRFKRKQRASRYWITKGKVPLNTISTPIDYGYYTITLPNSAITVKVWLNRDSIHDQEYYQRLI